MATISQGGIFIPRSDTLICVSSLRVRDEVVLHSLRQHYYNGRYGIVMSDLNAQGRQVVELSELYETGTHFPGEVMSIKPSNLKLIRSGNERHTRLLTPVRALRHYDGAEIMDPENLVPSTFFNYTGYTDIDMAIERFKLDCVIAFMMGTHPRLGEKSALQALENAQDCLKVVQTSVKKGWAELDLEHLETRMRMFTIFAPASHWSIEGLSACAKAYWPLIQSLTREQLNEYYELACAERWDESKASLAREHSVEGRRGVQLEFLLATFEGCDNCAANGKQYFCFCMNRAVSSDRVYHCHVCGCCFYFRPCFMHRCSHCNYKHNIDSNQRKHVNSAKAKWPLEAPNPQEEHMRAKGYWQS